jgi:XRE family aerobic/anaerobic benzoate catabolism transcriptional regulator
MPTDTRDEKAFLVSLGQKLRRLRALRGMTRKSLARDSGLSERYIAQIETGQGNISVLLLRQLAKALDVPPTDLFELGPERSAEMTRILGLLRRLSPNETAEARRVLEAQFEAEPFDRRQRIALIGLRGAGKSALGKKLAEHLRMPFIELDREIEREAGLSLSELFALYGQGAFRRYEQGCLERLTRETPRFVLAAGGGIVSEPASFDLLLKRCYTIWLKARPEDHMARVVAQGDLRPMADNEQAMEDLKQILTERTPRYARADDSVETSGKTEGEALRDLVRAAEAAAVAS